MTLVLALGYGVAAASMVAVLALRTDRRVSRRIDEVVVPDADRGWSPLAAVGELLPASTRDAAKRRFGASAAEIERLMGLKVLGAAAGALVGALLGSGGVAGVGLALIMGAGGFVLPTFRRARRARAEALAIRRSAPDLLDLVAVSVSAGTTPRLALERARRVVGDPLSSALGEMAGAVSLGAPWLASLRRAAETSGAPELTRLAATLSMSVRLGSPVADRVRALAHDVRAERRAEAEARARRAPVTMLFPLVFLILPAFVLTAVAPALIVATRDVA